ncbi:UNVERIFIED_CONTAM: ribosome silencing factor [Comamonas sp. A-3]|uniref:Ribosomal silencing factor RsfS n=1 Tax=Comamonas thiooxydans TaxID=363952 RepID=A0A454Y2E5_9BURK|nr:MULTISPECIES: ribosome silencing factor [Comamonas]ACY33642.1 iojap-like protein [Comamonas thiooxydans]KGH13598.1 ribosome-associated protein IOJAP [Comamonas thiooxydans]KGH22693.1 ribosome-associated protein IOJAP [Comamonas thiooxydans]KGH24273.1 ribosome-associated protein IOJAP [Comamonas thiooxydans]MDN5505425.1 ribosome silencing factor [Comamonas sp.]
MTTSTKSDSAAKRDVTKLQRAIVDGLEDVKAHDIQVFNTEALSPLFERVIVASGTSNRQTKALASSVREAVKEAGFPVPRQEGEQNGEWIIVDCGSVVCHIMQPAIRQYYRLEEIWGETPVRMKIGAAKPKPAEVAAKKLAAKLAVEKAAAENTVVEKKPAAKKAAAKKPAAKTAAGAKPAAKKPAAKSAAAKTVKTVVVKPSTPRTAKPVAAKPAAKRAPRAKA